MIDETILQYFVCNQSKIEEKIRGYLLIEEEEDASIYLDSKNSERWLKIYFFSEMDDKEYTVLENEDKIDIDSLVFIATNSTKREEIICACNELVRRENSFGSDFRESLINAIESRAHNLKREPTNREKESIKLIIYESDLYDSTNKKPILGKNYSVIQEDAKFYRGIAERAKSLISQYT